MIAIRRWLERSLETADISEGNGESLHAIAVAEQRRASRLG